MKVNWMFSDRVLLVNTLTKTIIRLIHCFMLPFIVKRNVKKRLKMAVFGTLFNKTPLPGAVTDGN